MFLRTLSVSLALVGGLFLLSPLTAQAALYAPGATLDPACAPTDLNCGVTPGVGSGTANSIPYYSATGSTLSATSTITILANGNVGVGATTTPGSIFSIQGVANLTTATSTFYGSGINLASGCFAVGGVCISGSGGVAGVSSVSNSDSTLTVTPTTGAAVASLNLAHANIWTGLQQFLNASATQLSANIASFGATATSSFGSNGALTLSQALGVSSGGTGWSALQAGGLLYGNGTGAVATTSQGTSGQVLAWLNGIPTWTATTTFSSGVAYANGNVTNTGVLSLAQTYGTGQTGALTFGTSSASLFNGLTVGHTITNSGGAFTFNAPTISGTLNNSGLTNSSLTVTAGNGLLGGGIVSLGGTINLSAQIATSSVPTLGGIAYWTGNGTPSTLGTVSTTTLTGNNGITLSASAGALIGGSNATIGLANIAANSLLGNSTGVAGTPTAIATSSLGLTVSSFASPNISQWTNNSGYTTLSSLAATYPIIDTAGTFSLAFGTSTSNTWGGTQTFTNPVSGSVTGTSANVTGTVAVANGGTGWSALQAGGLLYGNGTGAVATTSQGTSGQVLAWLNGIPTWTATTTFSSGVAYANGNVTNTGLLSLAQTYGSAQTGNITFATTSQSFNGLTAANTITNSGAAFTIAPLWTGTLNNSGLTNSTIGATSPNSSLSFGAAAALGSTFTADLNLANANYWTGLQNFTNASTSQLTATSSVYLATAAGNVGIGTTSPTAPFEFVNSNGDIQFTSQTITDGPQSAVVPNITFSGTAGGQNAWSGSTQFTYNNAGFLLKHNGGPSGGSTSGPQGLGLSTNGRTIADLFIDSTGNVGIGGNTNNLNSLNTLGSILTVSNNASTVANTPLLTVASTTGGTSTTTLMTILANGNVGIGATTTPGSILSIQGVANFTSATSTFYGNGLNLTSGCFAVNGTCLSSGGGGGVTSISNSDGTLTINPTTGAAVASLNLANANYWTGLQNFTNASTSQLTATSSVYLATTAGSVGIGTTTPFTLLQEAGTTPKFALSDTSAGLNAKHWWLQSSGGTFSIGTTSDSLAGNTTYLNITNGGNVGIASSSPFSLLSVGSLSGTVSTPLAIASNNKTFKFFVGPSDQALIAGSGFYLGTNNNEFSGAFINGPVLSSQGGNGSWQLSGTNSTVSYINAGNVGIGTTTPTEKLALTGGNFVQTVTTAPTIKGTLTSTAFPGAIDVYASGKYAYVAGSGSNSSLAVVDISNPTAPTLLGSVSDAVNLGGAFWIGVSGKYAYVTANSRNQVTAVDISNPAAPFVASSLTDAVNVNSPRTIVVSGKYAYIASTGTNRMTIVDISNPYSLSVVSSILDATNLNGIDGEFLSGKYLYITAHSGNLISVIDVSNPKNPFIVGSSAADLTNTSNPHEIEVVGKYAYVASQSSNSLAILDVSNPAAPTLTGSIIDNTNLNSAKHVVVAGRYAYVTANSGGRLAVIDVSNPALPVVVSTLTDSTNLNTARGMFLYGKYLVTVATSVSTTNGILNMVSIDGIDTPSASIGSLNAQTVVATNDVNVGGSVNVRGSLNVNGLYSNGPFTLLGSGLASTTNTADFRNASGTQLFAVHDDNTVGIGTTSPFALLSIATPVGSTGSLSTLFAIGSSTGSATTTLFSVANNGNVTINGSSGSTCTIGNGTGGTSCTSDERLKTNITPISNALAGIEQLRGITFNWIDPTKDQSQFIGVIAQDVQKVFPQVVSTNSDGYLTVDYASLVAPLIEAVKELAGKVNAMAQSFTSQNITAQQKLCVGQTCITEDQLKVLLQNSGQQSATAPSSGNISTGTSSTTDATASSSTDSSTSATSTDTTSSTSTDSSATTSTSDTTTPSTGDSADPSSSTTPATN